MIHFQVFLAKVLNQLMPSLTLGSIQSKWVSRDKKQVSEREMFVRACEVAHRVFNLLAPRLSAVCVVWAVHFFIKNVEAKRGLSETIARHHQDPTCCCL